MLTDSVQPWPSPDGGRAKKLMESVAIDAAEVGLRPDGADLARRNRRRWASSGLMGLTGPASSPLLVDTTFFDRWATLCQQAMAAMGDRSASGLRLRPRSLLTTRARRNGFGRRGRVSANGHCHLFATADGFVALNLARPSDLELLSALLETPVPLGPENCGDASRIREVLEPLMPAMATATVLDRGALLGLAVAEAAAPARRGVAPGAPFSVWTPEPPADAIRSDDPPRILDLAPLWAGPLAAQLLGRVGSPVVRVESANRPDGLRQGDPEHWEELNGAKELHVLDLPSPAGIVQLQQLIDQSDVVISGARPRVFGQWGIDVRSAVCRGQVWVAITGHGSHGAVADRVAFGDDAAVAGALMAWLDGAPNFVGDAVADPVAGVTAALAGSLVWRGGGGALVDVAMARAVRWLVQDDSMAGTVPDRDAEGRIVGDGAPFPIV